ncbi:hypothetical protein DM02DRAFT_656422 [Periconia macrospinosa]|uniref:Uncharacterized protein n=1 Tax=Periconia macrospinosa TaxID=97972 RepID=A0A2V1DMC7_9PLEO|nr:hypothetical protein DM02DRAFT_656422 [Periconia macrospinosa]
MPALTFNQLPREMRDMIWAAAAAAQYQHIADGLSKFSTKPGAAERLRQAFVGYESLPEGVEKQPLRLCVNDNGERVRLLMNEFQTLVNRVPIATVCLESRLQAIDFCRSRVDIVDLHYTIDPSDRGDEIINRLLQPTTVVVTNTYNPYEPWDAPSEFDSAEHFVAKIDRLFGSNVEHVVLNRSFYSFTALERIYWPHVGCTRDREKMDGIYIDEPSHDKFDIFMTPDRRIHAKEELFGAEKNVKFNLQTICHHLLKFYEIWDACKKKQKLLSLRTIQLQLYTYNMGDILPTQVKAVIKDGVLWANWHDCQIGDYTDFISEHL